MTSCALKIYFIIVASPIFFHLSEWTILCLGFSWCSTALVIAWAIAVFSIAMWLGFCCYDFVFKGSCSSKERIFKVSFGLFNVLIGSWCLMCVSINPFTICWTAAAYMFLSNSSTDAGTLFENVLLLVTTLVMGLITACKALVLCKTMFVLLLVFGIWTAPLVLYVVMVILDKLMH